MSENAVNNDVDVFCVTIEYKGKRFLVNITNESTLDDFKKEIATQTNVPLENQKLMVPKRALHGIKSDDLVKELLQRKNINKIKLLGNTVVEKENFETRLQKGEEFAAKLRIRNDLKSNDSSKKKVKNRYKRKEHDKPEYRFYKFKALDGFSDRKKAKMILKKLANDPGILHVLKEFKWKMPLLSEMYPEGKVGISAVCVLGLNVNRGQEIKLRIRTDDLKGFRKYSSMLKVLYHELAHNKFGDHNDDFYRFMREIQNLAEANNWKRSEGITLGGMKTKYRPNILDDSMSDVSSLDSSEDYDDYNHNHFTGRSHVVGSSNNEEFDGLSLREKAALAARKRLQQQQSSQSFKDNELDSERNDENADQR